MSLQFESMQYYLKDPYPSFILVDMLLKTLSVVLIIQTTLQDLF